MRGVGEGEAEDAELHGAGKQAGKQIAISVIGSCLPPFRTRHTLVIL